MALLFWLRVDRGVWLHQKKQQAYYANPENAPKILARQLVSKAKRDKVLTQPHECNCCGRAAKRIEAHHPDYRFPFDVIWLCVTCHRWYEGVERYVSEHAEYVRTCAKIVQFDKWDMAQVIENTYGRFGIEYAQE